VPDRVEETLIARPDGEWSFARTGIEAMSPTRTFAESFCSSRGARSSLASVGMTATEAVAEPEPFETV
jgi:hypothetical protein